MKQAHRRILNKQNLVTSTFELCRIAYLSRPQFATFPIDKIFVFLSFTATNIGKDRNKKEFAIYISGTW